MYLPFHPPIMIIRAAAGFLSIFVFSASAAVESPASTSGAKPMTDNPLLKESSLDFHYPLFDKITDEDFAPAYEQGMAEQLKEIEPIASNAESPTFENTIVALEKTGQLLGRVEAFRSAGCNLPQRPALQARRDSLQQARPARTGRGIELAH
jgi:peptidyl-dipeptidase Dcp